MPETGIDTPDLATAAKNLQDALQEFQRAWKANPTPRPLDTPVFGALRAWRTEQARTRKVPPYVIATDAMLKAIEAAQPTTLQALHSVKGFSPAKAQQYGEEILQVILRQTAEAAA